MDSLQWETATSSSIPGRSLRKDFSFARLIRIRIPRAARCRFYSAALMIMMMMPPSPSAMLCTNASVDAYVSRFFNYTFVYYTHPFLKRVYVYLFRLRIYISIYIYIYVCVCTHLHYNRYRYTVPEAICTCWVRENGTKLHHFSY